MWWYSKTSTLSEHKTPAISTVPRCRNSRSQRDQYAPLVFRLYGRLPLPSPWHQGRWPRTSLNTDRGQCHCAETWNCNKLGNIDLVWLVWAYCNTDTQMSSLLQTLMWKRFNQVLIWKTMARWPSCFYGCHTEWNLHSQFHGKDFWVWFHIR